MGGKGSERREGGKMGGGEDKMRGRREKVRIEMERKGWD